jgi:hypothetical protein
MVHGQDTTTTAEEDMIDYSPLGSPTWFRLRAGWSLTVSDQCIYEFIFQFEHDDTLPLGDAVGFEGNCAFKNPSDPDKNPYRATEDGEFYLAPRKMWDRFPDYVGFNHLSVDWYPCGKRPKGYALPQYDLSFFRVTPEFRVQTMNCSTLNDDQVIIPNEQICDENQATNQGKEFFIVPGALVNRNPIVNMPTTFTPPENGPVPTVGLRSFDQTIIPEFPNEWESLVLMMSTYGGDLAMFQPHVPYKLVSGAKDIFTSQAHRYYETTIGTLPDTYAFDYDESEGTIRYHMVGKAGLCRSEFEAAESAAGGPPIFPDYDALEARGINGTEAAGDGTSTNGSGGTSLLAAVGLLSSSSVWLLVVSAWLCGV